ncbi:alpha/beta fold hydrolase [Nocardia asteroides NBRC 15531]|uniref:Epoxide hydrolase n=1 Tax=Nocardia asteroides NBRC 15531 TaxID=1110697 RepID=U5E3A6_NOCAS|nr:epoxide hydrolase family protein [Nocardia asteroides]TLF66755.1 alpha/beta fold hydrolase [Nocardia asteroides NBRC 15531]UGT46130.1 epoxide hydrolase 1 [Nocardia asteroides]SFN00142.1 Pimeloyl-ACP methyl ester carboxylesterase [Nocardia asteroides]VEG35077.1 Soluble epoxide hydrolase [Nocardia asteroides]GAD82197.1 putative epoxide hydrolase [Nocardia asteroides NBRC 15531]
MYNPTSDVLPFAAHTPDAELDDLRARLAAARFPEAETVYRAAPDPRRWDQGVPLADLIEVVHYWRTGYDWRAFEERLDRIGQFRTIIDGLGIHFLHRRSPRADATPLLLTHGWPDSIVRFIDIIDELTNPKTDGAQAFHVVVPSLPGFGYSDKPATTGWGTEKIAAAWVELMGRLGYGTFLAHGGDWGGNITTVLGGRFPGHVLGIHTTFAEAPPGAPVGNLTAAERTWVEETRDFWRHRAAYAKQQATRPQTIGYSLVDSPVGLLAWILDKFAEWSDTDDSPFETISLDRILDDVTLYWLTRSGASAARIYYESHNSLDPDLRVDVPSALTMYPRDTEKCPRPLAQQRYRKIVRWSTPESGGHFPSLEVPDFFVADLREGLTAALTQRRLESASWR